MTSSKGCSTTIRLLGACRRDAPAASGGRGQGQGSEEGSRCGQARHHQARQACRRPAARPRSGSIGINEVVGVAGHERRPGGDGGYLWGQGRRRRRCVAGGGGGGGLDMMSAEKGEGMVFSARPDIHHIIGARSTEPPPTGISVPVTALRGHGTQLARRRRERCERATLRYYMYHSRARTHGATTPLTPHVLLAARISDGQQSEAPAVPFTAPHPTPPHMPQFIWMYEEPTYEPFAKYENGSKTAAGGGKKVSDKKAWHVSYLYL